MLLKPRQLQSEQSGCVLVAGQLTSLGGMTLFGKVAYDEPTPKFAIDLSYCDTFNDEPALEPMDEPLHLCLDNAEDNQNVLVLTDQVAIP